MKDPVHRTPWASTLAILVKIEDSQSIDTLLPINHDHSVSAKQMLCGCEMVRSSTTDLDTLRSLPPPGFILLLTPVLVPAASKPLAQEAPHTDPFEALGRSISKHHARVRHQPYVPKVGLTATHSAFMSEAAAIILVACEPASARSDGAELQARSAKSFAACHRRSWAAAENPLVLVQFGNLLGHDEHHDLYENVVLASRACEETFDRVTSLLFAPNP